METNIQNQFSSKDFLKLLPEALISLTRKKQELSLAIYKGLEKGKAVHNVALPLREHSKLPKGEIGDRVHEVLRLVGMDHAAAQFPPSISGGMKLRAGLARALVTKPEYVLYDEPNAGLDPIISEQIHTLIAEVRDTLHVTGLIVTHSRACATQCGDRIGIIADGKIAIEGTVDEMQDSDNELANAFLSVGSD